MLFITRNEFYRELNNLKNELRADYNNKSNIDVTNHAENVVKINENSEGAFDLAEILEEQSEAVLEIAEILTSMGEE